MNFKIWHLSLYECIIIWYLLCDSCEAQLCGHWKKEIFGERDSIVIFECWRLYAIFNCLRFLLSGTFWWLIVRENFGDVLIWENWVYWWEFQWNTFVFSLKCLVHERMHCISAWYVLCRSLRRLTIRRKELILFSANKLNVTATHKIIIVTKYCTY